MPPGTGFPLEFRRLPPLRALALAARQLAERLESQLRPLGVSASDAWFLLLLLEAGEARTTVLARALGVTFSTMTEMTDRMERAGRVERRRDPLDRRAVALRLTEAGHRLALEISRKLAGLERLISRELPAADRESFRRALEAMLKAVSG